MPLVEAFDVNTVPVAPDALPVISSPSWNERFAVSLYPSATTTLVFESVVVKNLIIVVLLVDTTSPRVLDVAPTSTSPLLKLPVVAAANRIVLAVIS